MVERGSGGGEESQADNRWADPEVLEVEYENATERLNQQREELREFSREGLRVFRLIILLVAGPAAILGALEPEFLMQIVDSLTNTQCAVTIICIPTNSLTAITGILLIFGVLLNIFASGYEVRGVHNLSNPEDISKTLSLTESSSEYYSRQLRAYQERILHNDKIIHIEESLLAMGKLMISGAIYFALTILYVIITDSAVPVLYWMFLPVLYIAGSFLLFRQAPSGYLDTDRTIRFDPLYDPPDKYPEETMDPCPDDNISENSEQSSES